MFFYKNGGKEFVAEYIRAQAESDSFFGEDTDTH